MSTTDPRHELRPAPATAATLRSHGVLPQTCPSQRALLSGSPRAVLRRLTQGDPLGLRARVARRLRGRFLLMDTGSVLRRALAHVAHDATSLRPTAVLEDWLTERIDRAIAELLPLAPESAAGGGLWRELAKPLGLDALAMARASARFNVRPLEQRRAFFQLVLAGSSLEACAERGETSPLKLAQAARSALQVFLEEEAAALEGGEA